MPHTIAIRAMQEVFKIAKEYKLGASDTVVLFALFAGCSTLPELAEITTLSVPTLRRSLALLVSSNLVEIEQGNGRGNAHNYHLKCSQNDNKTLDKGSQIDNKTETNLVKLSMFSGENEPEISPIGGGTIGGGLTNPVKKSKSKNKNIGEKLKISLNEIESYLNEKHKARTGTDYHRKLIAEHIFLFYEERDWQRVQGRKMIPITNWHMAVGRALTWSSVASILRQKQQAVTSTIFDGSQTSERSERKKSLSQIENLANNLRLNK